MSYFYSNIFALTKIVKILRIYVHTFIYFCDKSILVFVDTNL